MIQTQQKRTFIKNKDTLKNKRKRRQTNRWPYFLLAETACTSWPTKAKEEVVEGSVLRDFLLSNCHFLLHQCHLGNPGLSCFKQEQLNMFVTLINLTFFSFSFSLFPKPKKSMFFWLNNNNNEWGVITFNSTYIGEL